MSLQITFNGKTYNSVDEMPPEARQAYEHALALLKDQDANGVPDFLDGVLAGAPADPAAGSAQVLTATQHQYIINGQSYSSVDAMPPAARQAYERAMASLDQDRDGVPDAFQSRQTAPAAASAPPPAPMPYTPAGVDGAAPAAPDGRLRGAAYLVFGLTALCLIAGVVLTIYVVAPSLIGLR